MDDGSSFEFINTSKPSEYLTPANRKLVRRHATLHRSRNQRKPQALELAQASTKHVCQNQLQPLNVGKALHPFPINFEQYMIDMLKYPEVVMGPSLFPLKSMYQYHPAHRVMVCLALQDVKVLNCAVAIASLRYASSGREDWNSNSNPQLLTALKQKQRAIELVRRAVIAEEGGDIDVVMATCMAHLATLELFVENENGWQVHIDALKKANQDEKRSKDLRLVQFTIIDVDLLGCYLFDKQPSFFLEYDSCYDLRTAVFDEALQQPFHTDDTPFNLDPHLAETLLAMRHLTSQIHYRALAHPETHVRSWVTTRICVEHSLLEILAHADVNSLTRSVCLAAQIYVNRVFRTFQRGAMILHGISKRLKNTIVGTLEATQGDEHTSALARWVGIMGGLGAQDGALREWFVESIRVVRHRLGVTTWDEVHKRLERWCWDDDLLGREGETLWREVETL